MIQNKPCITCGAKDAEFYKYEYTTNQGKRSIRRESRCVECARARRRAKHHANPEKGAAESKAWRMKNADHVQAYRREYFSGVEGRAYRCALQNKRRAAQLQRTPVWADHDKIEALHRLAAAFSELYVPHEVDHIVPLQGDFVSGLHVEYNLQVIPADDNRKKWKHFKAAA